MTARLLVGDVFDRMAELPDGSVDLVMTSPPFLALRSYLPADHPDKGKEIGSEPNPAEFLDTLLALTAEWRRLLAPQGSICVELGDTYASGGVGGLRLHGDRYRGYSGGAIRSTDDGDGTRVINGGGSGWPLAKSLCGIPHLYHLSLAYGRNLLTGEPSPAGQWRVRNVVAWCRPNPPVGALGDKVRPATSYLTMACVGPKRWFDLDAVRAPGPSMDRDGEKRGAGYGAKSGSDGVSGFSRDCPTITNHPGGAPPLDHWWHDDVFDQDAWLIPTAPYKGAHYATFPPALVERPVKMMCPLRVCRDCGEPSRRIVEREQLHSGKPREDAHALYTNTRGDDQPRGQFGAQPEYVKTSGAPSFSVKVTTLGWSDCGHNNWRNGHVLDPFAGSGTTLAVATGHGRDATGIELDARNIPLIEERVGRMFLDIDHGATA